MTGGDTKGGVGDGGGGPEAEAQAQGMAAAVDAKAEEGDKNKIEEKEEDKSEAQHNHGASTTPATTEETKVVMDMEASPAGKAMASTPVKSSGSALTSQMETVTKVTTSSPVKESKSPGTPKGELITAAATTTTTTTTNQANASASASAGTGPQTTTSSPSKVNATVAAAQSPKEKEKEKEKEKLDLPPALVEACEGDKGGVVKAENLYKIVQKALGEKHLRLENKKAGKGIQRQQGVEEEEEKEEEGRGLNVEIDEQGWSLLSGIAEQLVMSTLQFAVKLVNHRKGSTIEPKDMARYLKTNMQINVHAEEMEDGRASQALKRRAASVQHWERQEEAKRLHTTNNTNNNTANGNKNTEDAEAKDVEMKKHALKL